MTTEVIHKPTPNGGVRAEIYYLNDGLEATEKDRATKCEIVEYDANNEVIHRTYGDIRR